jgi:type IV pilus assembly protein PilP
MMRKTLTIALSCLALAACSGEQHSDLRQFVKESDNLPRGRIPPLPEVKPYEPFTYNAYDITDPFKPRSIAPPKSTALVGSIKPPPADRRKEPLEAYPLENLKMVGTLQQKKEIYAVVRTPDNRLFRVKPGNFLGQNFGRITDISESAIKIKELIQDSGGEWKEEERSLLLQEG